TTVAAFQVGRRYDGGATSIGFATSLDGGRTWRSGFLPSLTRASSPPGPHERASDPVVAYDAVTGTWLVATLALEGQTTRLTVSRSRDGLRWSEPVVAAEAVAREGIAFDKEWLACDGGSASPRRGTCYLVATDELRGGSLAVLSSRDGGASWAVTGEVPVTKAVGAIPVVRPNGDLVVVFLWRGRSIAASTSRDGGATFSEPVVAAVQARSAPGLRFFPLPAAEVAPDGRVIVAWHDCRFSRGCARNAIVTTSSDDGSAWTPLAPAVRGRNAMLPALGIHPRTGRRALAYHVVRPDRGVDVELVELDSGGLPLGAPRRLSARTMRPDWMPSTRSGRMLADYISVTYVGARPLVVWVLATEPEGPRFRQAVYATLG
ncbi:MAG: glycoside hydrolase, partial [Gaiellaceae bacterium]|nr:glycoside hydrolase [Gaiellaceae bacterium]